MIDFTVFDRRPIVVAIAGPNGAGKTTFFHSHLASAGLRFLNADMLAADLAVGPYKAAEIADVVRRQLLDRGESFIFETVLSDPLGRKVAFSEYAVGPGWAAEDEGRPAGEHHPQVLIAGMEAGRMDSEVRCGCGGTYFGWKGDAMSFGGLPGGSPGPGARCGWLGLLVIFVASLIGVAALLALLFYATRSL